MKKTIYLSAALLAFSLSACSPSETVSSTQSNQTETGNEYTENEKDMSTVILTTLNGNKEIISLEVPYDPQRIAVLDMAALDILDSLGVGDRIVGSAQTSLEYLQEYADNDSIQNLGTIKEADLEAVMESAPDVIFIGGRLSSSYDALSEIAPVVYLSTDIEKGVVQSIHDNAEQIASIFGLEEKVEELMNGYQKRIDTLHAFAENKTAVIGMATSGSFNLLGNDGRCSLIGVEIGFENIGVPSDHENASATATHGNETSFELISELNPDYIFVMDRDSAIGSEGAQLAKDIMENELIMSTNAYQNNHLVYLEHPAVWYTAEGGIQALDLMLSDLEQSLEISQ